MKAIMVYGTVQAVGFRPFVYRIAIENNVSGYVRNRGEYVEIVIDGAPKDVEQFIFDLNEKKPPLSKIDRLDITDKSSDENYKKDIFYIKESKSGNSSSASIIPPDICVCVDCQRELFEKSDRRFLYPFINCTNCGPRFTIIKKTPYDREMTTMGKFKLCPECLKEYKDVLDRRYHAEPVACPTCGPHYSLCDRLGKKISNPIETAARLLEDGKIIAIKGLGGYHIGCDALNDNSVKELRKRLGRPYQPFAILGRDVKTAEKVTYMNEEERKSLSSFERPIVVLEKKDPSIFENIAPGLHNVGIMVPYSPLHFLLFKYTSLDFFVMTSANMPGDPMIIEDKIALESLDVDYFLNHNLEIYNRCDDSVIRDGRFIRRSRGFVPQGINIPHNIKVLAFGAELNNTFTLTKEKKSFISQHIGNTTHYDTILFFEDALRKLLTLLNMRLEEIELLICDLHPHYETTKLAEKYSIETGIPLIKIQHHITHAKAVLTENNFEEGIAIVCDGTGYGLDGKSWGGEIFHVTKEGEERIGHIEEYPLLGGDRAAKEPVRILASLLPKENLDEFGKKYKYGIDGIHALQNLVSQEKILSTSCGRILDMFSVMLGASTERTYEGEPAMKLESLAWKGKDLKIPIEIEDNRIMIKEFSKIIFDMRNNYKKQDLAKTVHISIAKAFSEIAIEAAKIDHLPVAFSGGVAYNKIFSDVIKKEVESSNLKYLKHRLVPCGDGGVSFGQSLFAYKNI
ncbi:MAG: carbamoyltransferase HypF [Candidatus Methanofastidiosa archaeon]|nr:carbamoyltransferase HypF [Candidatus Methanofastidiosa archaeon]